MKLSSELMVLRTEEYSSQPGVRVVLVTDRWRKNPNEYTHVELGLPDEAKKGFKPGRRFKITIESIEDPE